MKTIANFYFLNKIPIIRVDFNVPHNNLFSRLYKIIISDRVQKTILISHLGLSHGEISNKFSLINIIPYLQKALKIQVQKCKEIIGNIIHRIILKNIRFFKEEDGNEVFAKQLSHIYVNDAFGVSHRSQTPITKITKFFPSLKYFVIYGKKPITAIIGGAKVSSKIFLLVNILPLRDHLLIAGGMAYNFIKILEGRVGNSIIDYYKNKSLRKKNHVDLPIDVIISDAMNKDANIKEQFAKKISKGWMGLDIGRKSIHEFTKVINRSLSIFWNGPLRVFYITNFSNGTSKGAFSMVGGGESILSRKKYKYKISYISTGGVAMLAILKGKNLPGVSVNN